MGPTKGLSIKVQSMSLSSTHIDCNQPLVGVIRMNPDHARPMSHTQLPGGSTTLAILVSRHAPRHGETGPHGLSDLSPSCFRA